jgi:hypothetical protein
MRVDLTALRPLVFLVRIWRADTTPAGFRAAVRAIDSESVVSFESAGALGDYLAEQAMSATAAPEDPGDAREPT